MTVKWFLSKNPDEFSESKSVGFWLDDDKNTYIEISDGMIEQFDDAYQLIDFNLKERNILYIKSIKRIRAAPIDWDKYVKEKKRNDRK